MRIKYIDVLKLFAIIAVVLFHVGILTYGYLGVDLFLVISGYLTTKGLYSKVIKSNLTGGWLGFGISRVIRLLPPLLVAGLFCMILGYFLMLPDDYENLSQSVIATNFFSNNILSFITTDYWDVKTEYKPLMQTWYVGVLMQFYIVYPLLFYVAKQNKRNPKRTLLTLISTLAVISLLVYYSTEKEAFRFYLLPSRFFEFAVGGIAALVYNPKEDRPFGKSYVYVCYAILIALMFVNVEMIPRMARLVVVVGLSCVMLCSQNVLENNIMGNSLLANIGTSSYSIFIWHQVLLAFYRYSITSDFSLVSYMILMAGTVLFSWLSYYYIEQKLLELLKLKNKYVKVIIYSVISIVFLSTSAYAGYIYIKAGVVRDIPELYIYSQDNIHRGMHAEYCDRGYNYDRPFSTEKKHWYVIGNSFGRDFVNVILESPIADSVEVSYSTLQQFKKESERFASADKVFISSLGVTEELVTEIELLSLVNGLSIDNVIVVGEKNFGVSNGQVYAKRNDPGYFDQYIDVDSSRDYLEKNEKFIKLYGDRYLDMMSFVSNDKQQVRVFTPDHHFISADSRHFSKGGAIYYGKLIDWSIYLSNNY